MAVVPIGGLSPAVMPLHDSDSTFLSQVPNGGGVYDPLLRATLQQLDLYMKSKGSSNTPIVLSGGTSALVSVPPGDQTIFLNVTANFALTIASGQNPGDLLKIKDIGGHLSTSAQVHVIPQAPATIDGQPSVFMQLPYASLDMVWDGTKWCQIAEPYPWLPLNPVLVNGTATVNPDALTEAQLIYVNNSSLAPMTLTLGAGQAVGQRVTIKDIVGNASTYPITVSVAPHTIETGATSVQLTAAFQSLELIWTGNWIQIPVLPPFALPPPVVINGGITVWTPGPQAFGTAGIFRHEFGQQTPDAIGRDVFTGEHANNAGGAARGRSVDAFNARMRMRRQHDHCVSLVRQLDIVDKAAAAGEKAPVLDPAYRLADAVGLHIKRLAHGRSLTASAQDKAGVN